MSAPKGRAIVFIPQDHAHLMKVNTIGTGLEEISFLSREDDVVYHPAGTHLAVVGDGPGRSYGIWQATNLGQKPRQLARAETARRVYSLSYAANGFLAFAADHGDHFDVHWLAPSGQLETAHSGREPVDGVVASPFTDSVAYRTGVCSGSTVAHAWVNRSDRALGGPLAGLSTEPVGWLPDGRLVILGRSHGCQGPADVYVWSENGATTLVTHGADRAAVRVVFPSPPPSPGAPGEAKG